MYSANVNPFIKDPEKVTRFTFPKLNSYAKENMKSSVDGVFKMFYVSQLLIFSSIVLLLNQVVHLKS